MAKVNPFDAEGFISSEDFSFHKLQQLRKVDLRAVADHVGAHVTASMRKAEIVKAIGIHMGLIEADNGGLSGEDQVELARISLEKERLRLDYEERERQMQRELELKKLQFEHEERMQELEIKSKIEKDTKKVKQDFDFSKNVKLVPRFCEKEVETYFLSFEKIAKRLEWPEKFWTVLLQRIFTGKAQEVFAVLSEEQSSDYATVKAAILNAYALVPEAYRQKFRKLKRQPGHTFVEFAREKELVLDRWYRSLKIEKNYENLRQLLLLEEFKNSIHPDVKSHLDEHKVKTVKESAVMADDYELTHRFGSKDSKFYQGRSWHTRRSYDQKGSYNRDKKSQGFIEFDKKPEEFSVDGNRTKFSKSTHLSCDYCHKKGHVRSSCWKLKQDEKSGKPVAFVNTGVDSLSGDSSRETIDRTRGLTHKDNARLDETYQVPECYRSFLSKGQVSPISLDDESKPVVILRDTGAAQSLMLASLLTMPLSSSVNALIQGIEGNYVPVPLHRVNLKSELVNGPVTVGVVSSLPIEGVTFLLGNDLAGDKVCASPHVSNEPVLGEETENLQMEYPGIFPSCVVTRSQSQQVKRDQCESQELGETSNVWLADTFFGDLDEDAEKESAMFTRDSLVREQQADSVIKDLSQKALSETEAGKVPECYYAKSGILMRKWRPPESPANEEWRVIHQVIVPPCYRNDILMMAHDIPLAGHLGIRKTQSRILQHFYWPKLHKDVVDFCKTCHTCQIIGKSQPAVKPAPLIPIPAFDEPFTRVLVDCVGPLPTTKSGYRFLLTIMDLSTRFPEAIPLKKITAQTVVEALVQFFTRYGLPKEIQSDQGSNFMSGIFKQVMKELGIKQLTSSAYHPQSQGALERYHQTLKTMLRAYCLKYPEDWDKGISFVVFATRDAPNESTGFTPFELVYGHEVRGPLKLVKEKFLAEKSETNLLDYVCTFRERLSKACEVARTHLQASQQVMKSHFDKKAKTRNFKSGDQVLVLLPIPGEPLKAKFSGPYRVIKMLSNVNVIISTPDRRKGQRLCHINMLKPYYSREPVAVVSLMGNSDDHSSDKLESGNELQRSDEMEPLSVKLTNSEILENLDSKLKYLSKGKQNDITQLVEEFKHLFTNELGCTPDAIHDVDVNDAKPIKQHPYRLNPKKLEKVREEIQYMLEHDIIEPSQSNWSSPIVMVPKSDGTQRFCIDYRKVNAVSKSDSYPIPRIEDCIDRVGRATYVSKIDLLKGYWQVPLSDRAKEISAFVTPDGLFQSKVMPFGMKNAPATFQRLMNHVTAGLNNCSVYIDDVLVYSDTWNDHIKHLRNLFVKISDANLVINLKKSVFAKAQVTYLGHVVGQGQVLPREAKVKAILDLPVPTNKRELRRTLGMTGFYRKFVYNFSDFVAPLLQGVGFR